MRTRLRVVRDDGKVLGYIGRDEQFPRKLAQVLGPPIEGGCHRVRPWLFGTPFATLYARELRAWSEAFVQMADELDRFATPETKR